MLYCISKLVPYRFSRSLSISLSLSQSLSCWSKLHPFASCGLCQLRISPEGVNLSLCRIIQSDEHWLFITSTCQTCQKDPQSHLLIVWQGPAHRPQSQVIPYMTDGGKLGETYGKSSQVRRGPTTLWTLARTSSSAARWRGSDHIGSWIHSHWVQRRAWNNKTWS